MWFLWSLPEGQLKEMRTFLWLIILALNQFFHASYLTFNPSTLLFMMWRAGKVWGHQRSEPAGILLVPLPETFKRPFNSEVTSSSLFPPPSWFLLEMKRLQNQLKNEDYLVLSLDTKSQRIEPQSFSFWNSN